LKYLSLSKLSDSKVDWQLIGKDEWAQK